MRFLIAALLLASSLGVSIAAQAWGQSSTKLYSPGGAYLGEARTNYSPGIDASIPLQVRPMDPNGFINAFQRGVELRLLQDQHETYEGAYQEPDLDYKLRRLHEAQDELRRVQEAVARRSPAPIADGEAYKADLRRLRGAAR